MQKKSSLKPILIVIGVIIAAALAYFYFSGDPVDTTTSLETEFVDVGTSEGLEILILLNQISALRFDNVLFNSPVYKSLVDHTVVVREQNVGRPNPFAPAFGAPVPTPTPLPRAR
jgi:hypothetical protein